MSLLADLWASGQREGATVDQSGATWDSLSLKSSIQQKYSTLWSLLVAWVSTYGVQDTSTCTPAIRGAWERAGDVFLHSFHIQTVCARPCQCDGIVTYTPNNPVSFTTTPPSIIVSITTTSASSSLSPSSSSSKTQWWRVKEEGSEVGRVLRREQGGRLGLLAHTEVICVWGVWRWCPPSPRWHWWGAGGARGCFFLKPFRFFLHALFNF